MTLESSSTPTYLLTWNPDHFKLEENNALADGKEVRWTCQSKQPKIGETVYLIRLGKGTSGIVARGKVTKEVHQDTDWRDPSNTRQYIRFRVDEHRLTCATGLLPMQLLKMALGNQSWSPQGSGISIAQDISEKLAELWTNGKGKHSLRQYVEWSNQDPIERRTVWLGNYRLITDCAEEARQDASKLSDDFLEKLWREASNGVAGLKQGAPSKAEFQTNISLLRKMTEMIMSSPDCETYKKILADWEVAVNSQQLNVRRPAAISRVFAAFSPERFTSIIVQDVCRDLLIALRDRFGLDVATIPANWCELNRCIKKCMSDAGLDNSQLLQNNIAMWQLAKSISTSASVNEDDIPEKEYMSNESQLSAVQIVPLNQIFYGPPGTGKTFETVDAALKILSPETLKLTRTERKKRFDELLETGEVKFVTFHQSFSYEDFVEGLRAVTDEDTDQIGYEVADGVFKSLCLEAKSGTFEKAMEALKKKLVDSGERLSLSTLKGYPFEIEYTGRDTFRVFPKSSSEQKAPYRAAVKDVQYVYETNDKSRVHNPSYVYGILQYLRKEHALPDHSSIAPTKTSEKKFVLIIDEINRGNISRIFGELITLIEPSKRAGAEEMLSVTLPYSKNMFSVPSNVYLIGTMNSTDRSLAGLDIALRRRFTFTELPPKPELLNKCDIEGVNIGLLLRAMNERIEVLLDRDHCLGHAYFLRLMDKKDASLNDLKFIFRQQIIPLLQEYFFEDWERIRWVLNDQNKLDTAAFVIRSSTNLTQLFGEEVAKNLQNADRRWCINEVAFDNIQSYLSIIGLSK